MKVGKSLQPNRRGHVGNALLADRWLSAMSFRANFFAGAVSQHSGCGSSRNENGATVCGWDERSSSAKPMLANVWCYEQ